VKVSEAPKESSPETVFAINVGAEMSELPSGTVTLLFTDIEGSTRLLQHLGGRYSNVLAEHRRLLRAAFAEHRGCEVSAEGDGFFVAFPQASDAVAAAVDGQRALAAHSWGEGVGLRVRMGMHSGEPTVVAGDYVGLDVHRAARICAAGHGGQVLLSGVTRELVGRGLAPGIELRDLGKHRLKDLTQPEQLYQLVIPSLAADFPALRTVERQRTNLPAPLTGFVGRRRELEEITTLLGRESVRLLTLTGPGGSGKTRLALRVAAGLVEEFPDGVVLVELASIEDPTLVPAAVAGALGIREALDQPVPETLTDRLGDQRLLLVLDNFEQVLPAAAVVHRLLVACAQVKVLVTSRAALHVSGEQEYPVPPMAVPDLGVSPRPDGDVASEAVALFADRARAVRPDFAVTAGSAASVAEICQRLDGLPLAIELAAVRIKLLPLEAMLERLQHRLPLLTGGARDLPARQQTLRATLEWSYRLLAPAEQRLFARLAVFAGGCTVEAAEAVCDLDSDAEVLAGLDSLVDKNLLRTSDGDRGVARVGMLETIREYAHELLDTGGEAALLARRHADYFLDLARQADGLLSGTEHRMWFKQLAADLDNFRAALAWSVAQQQYETTAELAEGLRLYWEDRGPVSEGLRWLDAALQHREHLSLPTLTRVLSTKAALLLVIQGDRNQAIPLLHETLRLARELGDTTRVVRTLSYLGIVADQEGDYQRSVALHDEAVALARTQPDQRVLTTALVNQSGVFMLHGQYAQARAALEESRVLARQAGGPRDMAYVLTYLATVVLAEQDYQQAIPMMEESLTLGRELESPALIAAPLCGLGLAALYQGDHDRASALFEEALTLAKRTEDTYVIKDCLWGLAGVADAKGQSSRLVRLWAVAVALDEAVRLLTPDVQPLRRRLGSTVRARLNADAVEAELAKGRAANLDEVVAYALGGVGDLQEPASR
jgi:predicted ATPase/class 3 adenylate cyclase